jgi:NADPH-dependent ferric siderophore reductase
MNTDDRAERLDAVRRRREPPKFRQVAVRRVEVLGPRMVRVTLAGDDLAGFSVERPAASVRVLLPASGAEELVIPAWNGNEFLLPDGRRPTIRTFTPRHLDAEALELVLDVVIHGSGPASEWAATAKPGALVAVSGPGRGYAIASEAPSFLLVGDETAIPAISQLLEALAVETQAIKAPAVEAQAVEALAVEAPAVEAPVPVQVHIEVAHPDARLPLPDHAQATVEWWDLPAGAPSGEALVQAVRDADLAPGTSVWAAGEAAAMQRIRRHLFDERGLPRSQATVRGYWKHGRMGDAEAAGDA